MRSQGRSRIASITLGALAAASLAACGSTTQLRLAGDPAAGAIATVQDVAVGQPVSVGSIMLCLTRPGTAVLRSVSVHQPTGEIAVQAFAVRLNPFVRGLDGLGAERSTISGLNADFNPDAPVKAVSGVCPANTASPPDSESAQVVELAVQVVRDAGDAAGGQALDVVYDVSGATATAVIPFGVWLCSTACPPEAETPYKP
jgi:hypothetical protein